MARPETLSDRVKRGARGGRPTVWLGVPRCPGCLSIPTESFSSCRGVHHYKCRFCHLEFAAVEATTEELKRPRERFEFRSIIDEVADDTLEWVSELLRDDHDDRRHLQDAVVGADEYRAAIETAVARAYL